MTKKTTRVISVVNRKGGVGKSTVTMLLASALAKNKRVIVLDCDEQRTVIDVLEMENEMYTEDKPLVEVKAIAPMFVLDFLKTFGSSYDVIFIDPPRITEDKTSNVLGQLLAVCDGVLIPVLGSMVDVLSTKAFLKVIEAMAEYKKGNNIPFRYYGFINRFSTRKDNEHAMGFLGKIGLPMFKEPLKDLKIFGSPSVYFSVLETAEGERRFRLFLEEFCKRFKI